MKNHTELLSITEQIELKKFAYSTARCITTSPEDNETSGDWIDKKAQQIYNWLINDYSLEEAKSLVVQHQNDLMEHLSL